MSYMHTATMMLMSYEHRQGHVKEAKVQRSSSEWQCYKRQTLFYLVYSITKARSVHQENYHHNMISSKAFPNHVNISTKEELITPSRKTPVNTITAYLNNLHTSTDKISNTQNTRVYYGTSATHPHSLQNASYPQHILKKHPSRIHQYFSKHPSTKGSNYAQC